MALDGQEVVQSEAPAESSSRSGSPLNWLKSRFAGDPEVSSSNGASPGTSSNGSDPRPQSETSTPDGENPPVVADKPKHAFQTDEELRRYEQSVSDRAIENFKKRSEQEQRQQTIQHYQARIREARQLGDLSLVGELATELQDYQDGVSSSVHSEESMKSVRESAFQEAANYTAATLDREYTTAFYTALPKPLQDEFGKWWNTHLQPDAQGRINHSPEAARKLIVEQLTKLHADHHRELGHRDIMDEIDKNPELRKAVIAAFKGKLDEPASVDGKPNSSVPYRTVRDVRMAVGNDEISAAEGRKLVAQIEARGNR